MKLVIAIVNQDDSAGLTHALTAAGFSSTSIDSTGQFLGSGNVTVLVGVDEEKVSRVLEIIRASCHRRSAVTDGDRDFGTYPGQPVEVVVGGATIFVVDVERFERV